MDNGRLTESTVGFLVCGRRNMDSPCRGRWNDCENRVIGSCLMLFCSVLIVSAQEQPVTGPEAKPQPSRQDLEQSNPVDIAPEPADPTERAIRTIRSRLHNDTLPSRSSNCTP